MVEPILMLTPGKQQANMNSPYDAYLDLPSQTSSGQSNPYAAYMQDQNQTPNDVQNAEKYNNQPVDQGECETFAEQITDGKNWGSTATSAFKNQVNAGIGIADPTLQGAVPGDKIYFAPDASNNYNGHVGVLVNMKGDFISADYDKVSMNNLSTWGQQPVGYVQVGLPSVGGTQ